MQIFIAAKCRLLKVDRHICVHIFSLCIIILCLAAKRATKRTVKSTEGTVCSAGEPAAESSAVEHITENIPENIIHISGTVMVFSIRSAISKATAVVSPTSGFSERISSRRIAHTSVESRHAEPVIQLSFFFITQDIIGFCDLLKPLLCLFVAGVCIRMVFFCQLAVCALDLLFICTLCHAKTFIIIPLCHTLHLLFSMNCPLARSASAFHHTKTGGSTRLGTPALSFLIPGTDPSAPIEQ